MKLSTKYFKADMLAGMVVFLVALPLCLGIAVASGAPPFAGIISGVIGGIAVGYLSNSNVSVSGPAAGLIAIILVAVTEMGYQTFLSAVVIAGLIQLVLGLAKAGGISSYFPTSVIEGMLVAIGIIIIKKEIPHAIGYDLDHQGDYFYYNILDDKNYFSDLIHSFNFAHAGSIIIAIVSIAIIVAFNKIPALKKLKAVPGALVAVVAGILLNELFSVAWPDIIIKDEHLVLLPVATSLNEFTSQFTAPSLQGFMNMKAWMVGITIAIVASIETLLCLEAGDKMDPFKRFSSANKELTAQGIGNMLSGLLGGIPMTSVIVRTSANINAGAKTKLAAIAHGVFLLVAILAIPGLLNKIPMASLAAILIMIGLKLASIKTFKHMWHNGLQQFIPFIVTVIAVVFTDLLKGVGIGLVVSIYFILKGNMKLAYFFRKEQHHTGETIHIELAQEVSFLNKAAIKQTLAHLPENCSVIINAANTVYIDYDVLEMIKDFMNFGSKDKNISVILKDFKEEYKMQDYVNNHVTN
ncbi:SulP family inorganic anion transporter [Sediminibacterium sp.]|uniref:SulP family inorganic anion transporter n=1 Tax=Sediminibacterium sp. TaxID=1917865 RepID=UPI002735BD57|nr:SulP family inorganic anion transporter [Sediminibacterium sp.]MDP3394575.1 SulP family inorganic anion transporter [Sediminibacterium sp.]MDP3568410.1 SulP family inorganic anion transporter [Sediminibacterium sp.]